ncbi:hypothetical protein GCM10010277_13090 [Streptomyces longisporoflavus]|nr:hypothetical protein GCM10010277_13090 [Streptomyces longisporoflavus]
MGAPQYPHPFGRICTGLQGHPWFGQIGLPEQWCGAAIVTSRACPDKHPDSDDPVWAPASAPA